MGGKHSSLPDLALLALAVANDGIGAIGFALHLGGKRHTAGGRNAKTQRAGGHIHTGNMLHIGVTLQEGIQLAQLQKLLLGEKALLGQRGIECRGGVALGKHQTVAVGVFRVGGVNIHLCKIEVGHYIGNRKRAAGVSRFCGMNLVDNVTTNLCCFLTKRIFLGRFHKAPPGKWRVRVIILVTYLLYMKNSAVSTPARARRENFNEENARDKSRPFFTYPFPLLESPRTTILLFPFFHRQASQIPRGCGKLCGKCVKLMIRAPRQVPAGCGKLFFLSNFVFFGCIFLPPPFSKWGKIFSLRIDKKGFFFHRHTTTALMPP